MSNVKNALKKKAENAPAQGGQQSIKQMVKVMQGEIMKALPCHLDAARFERLVFTALSSNPKLQECTPKSFIGAMMTCAQLGLEPNTPLGQSYLIPFRNKGVMECQMQIGYKGMLDLAYRNDNLQSVTAQVVHSNDLFEYELGLDAKLKHIPKMGADRGEPIAYYAVWKTKNGGYGFEVMSLEDVKAHRDKYSQAHKHGSSPWNTAFDSMALKTVLKKALKYAPLSIDYQRAISNDETIKTDVNADMSEVPNVMDYNVDDEPLTYDVEVAPEEAEESENMPVDVFDKFGNKWSKDDLKITLASGEVCDFYLDDKQENPLSRKELEELLA